MFVLVTLDCFKLIRLSIRLSSLIVKLFCKFIWSCVLFLGKADTQRKARDTQSVSVTISFVLTWPRSPGLSPEKKG